MARSKPTAPPPRNALVTGAADRIGAAIARRLAAEGWNVVVHYRGSTEKAKATVAAIAAAGGNAKTVKADLASRSQRGQLIAKAAAAFGPLTLLVNNASSFERDSVADLDEALWDAHFAVHVEAPAFLSRDFAAQLPKDTDGNIVNIIDERVLHTAPSYFSYTLSKSALWAMTRTLAQSLAPRIRVNAIGPGPTVPPPWESQASHDATLAALPLKRGAVPDEIAGGLLNILDMKAMTGQMLVLDGGQHIAWSAQRGPTPRK